MSEDLTPTRLALELLRDVAPRVTEDTWCQGSYAVLPDGTASDDYLAIDARLCLQGHVYRAAAYHPVLATKPRLRAETMDVAIEALDAAVAARRIGPDLFAVDWQDQKGRTADQVRDLLLRAASRLDATLALEAVLA